MRILHITCTANRASGGPIEGIVQLNQTMRTLGHTTEVATLDAPDSAWLAEYPMTVHPLGPTVSSYCYSKNLEPWLRDHASEYDHFIINGIWQHNSFIGHKVLSRLKRPYLIYTHGMLDPWFKKAYPLKHIRKSIYWPWGQYPSLRDAKAVCFTCEEERILARQSFRPYRCNEVVVSYGTSAPAGDRTEQCDTFLNRFPELRGKRIFLFLSRIHPKKGCDLLIEAFADAARMHQDLHLVIAGPDKVGWTSKLKELAERLHIAHRVTWTGMLSGDAKWGAFHSAEVFVLPSHQENFGIAVAEALACGVPVLISNKVNIWREIEADGVGLVQEDDLAGTTELLRHWLRLSQAEKDTMRARAKRCFTERFEIHQAAQSLLKILDGETAGKTLCPQP